MPNPPRKALSPRAALAAKKADMSREVSRPGFIGRYLSDFRAKNAEGADSLEADIAELFSSEMGLRVLILLEKSTLFVGAPDGAPDSALREHNAVRNLVLEIRRYVAHGR